MSGILNKVLNFVGWETEIDEEGFLELSSAYRYRSDLISEWWEDLDID